ncbi:MAG: hypothetical protein HRU20_00775 [Pseudomonadales bacterium]|nr:hypothetical protein [Pseudomonadales bacterium]
MEECIDDFIAMNESGLVLELCEKYYDENVLMLNNGTVFAESMREAYDKQKGFVETVTTFEVKLVSKVIKDDYSELIFDYKMTGQDGNITAFTGKHIQIWKGKKIIKEEYLSIEG